jgi:hypothetical protein
MTVNRVISVRACDHSFVASHANGPPGCRLGSPGSSKGGFSQQRPSRLRTILSVIALSVLVSACSATGGPATQAEPDMAPAERVGMMGRLGNALQAACGENNSCAGQAVRFAGFLWEYRENAFIQTRVYRCLGQYALRQGYSWGVRRFVDGIADEQQASGVLAYMYQCAVPGWARSFFDADDPSVPEPPAQRPAGMRTAPAAPAPGPGPGIANPAADIAAGPSAQPRSTPSRAAPVHSPGPALTPAAGSPAP